MTRLVTFVNWALFLLCSPWLVLRVSGHLHSAQESSDEEHSPEGQRDKEISLYQFILSLFDRVERLFPGDFAGLLMCRPGSSQLGTHVAKRGRIVFVKWTGCLAVQKKKIKWRWTLRSYLWNYWISFPKQYKCKLYQRRLKIDIGRW